jgi:hypothetical protein
LGEFPNVFALGDLINAPSPTLSYQHLQTTQLLSDSELYDKIRRTVELGLIEVRVHNTNYSSTKHPSFR